MSCARGDTRKNVTGSPQMSCVAQLLPGGSRLSEIAPPPVKRTVPKAFENVTPFVTGLLGALETLSVSGAVPQNHVADDSVGAQLPCAVHASCSPRPNTAG